MQEQQSLPTLKTLYIPGYVIDDDILNRINIIANQSLSNPNDENSTDQQVNFQGIVSGNEELRFETVETLISQMDSESDEIKSISLKYNIPGRAGINIIFQQRGTIRLSAFNREADFQLNIDRLDSVIRECDQEYSWAIRMFVFGNKIKHLLAVGMVTLSIALFLCITFYLLTLKIGVNVDPSLIPGTLNYYHEVETAIKSNDVGEKLNVLLKSQLQGFMNAQDILSVVGGLIKFLLLLLVIITMAALLRRAIVRLYPATFFSFGRRKNILARLQRKREIWNGAIVIGFVVNLIAGLILALLIR